MDPSEQHGLQGCLITFHPHAFTPRCQRSNRKLPMLWAFLLGAMGIHPNCFSILCFMCVYSSFGQHVLVCLLSQEP